MTTVDDAPGQPTADPRPRVVVRRVVVVAVVLAQLALVVRAYWSDHDEFGFQMFPESSTWAAEIVRVTADGRAVAIDEPWPGGYRWNDLVTRGALSRPAGRHHADAGIDNQLAFLASALDWVAENTPGDTETLYLEATVTYWRNSDGPFELVLRSERRQVP